MTPLASKFERPAQFDLAAYWKESTERFAEQRGHFLVTLRIAPNAVQGLAMWCTTTTAPDGLTGMELNGVPEDWVAALADFDNQEQARFVVLGLGSRVRVLGPAEFVRGIFEPDSAADDRRAVRQDRAQAAADFGYDHRHRHWISHNAVDDHASVVWAPAAGGTVVLADLRLL